MSNIGDLVASITSEVMNQPSAVYCALICDVRSAAGAKAIQWYLTIRSEKYRSVPLQLGAAGTHSDEFSAYIHHQAGLWLLHLMTESRGVYLAKGIQTEAGVIELPNELMTRERAQGMLNPLAPKVIEIARQFP